MLDDEKIFTNEQIGVSPSVVKQIERRKPILSAINFVKKHKPIFIITASVLAIAAIIFFLLPEITINKTSLVNLGASVKITAEQTAKVKDRNVSVQIVNFINDTCPEGTTCFWSGQAVEYSLTVDGQKYATGSAGNGVTSLGYQVQTESSDYKTYAIIKIVKSDEN